LVKTGPVIITDSLHEDLGTFQYLAVIGYHSWGRLFCASCELRSKKQVSI